MKPFANTAASTSTVIVPGTLVIRDIQKRAGGSFKVGKLSTHIGQFEVKNPELDQYEPGTYSGNFCIDKIFPSHYIAGGKIVIEMRAVLSCFVLAGFDTETGEVEPLDVDPADTEEAAPASSTPAPATDSAQGVSQEAAPVTSTSAPEPEFTTRTHRLVPTRNRGYVGVEVDNDGNPIAVPADSVPADETPAPDSMKVMSVEEEKAFREAQLDKELFGEDLYPLGTEVKLDPTVGRAKLRSQCDRLKGLGFKFQAARQTWVQAA